MIPTKKSLAVKVTRPFHLNGSVTTVGQVLTLPTAFAREMVTAGKVELATAAAPAPPATVITSGGVKDLTPPTTKGK